LVHAGKPQAGIFADLSTLRPEPGTNICHQFRFARGDSAGALASADLVLDDTYRFPPVQHYAMEPHAAVAVWSETDGLTIWASSQNPYSVRVELAKMFDVPLARMRPPPGSAAIRSSSGGRTSWPTAKSSRRATRRSTASSRRACRAPRRRSAGLGRARPTGGAAWPRC